jgi:D-glycero-D-manno-heptose 1,7-bisphosphate phosphatase
MKRSPADGEVVVLDRDGTIVVDRQYLADPEALEFEPGARAGLQRMSRMGCRLVLITNQSGVARGFFSLGQLDKVHGRLRRMLEDIGSPLEGIYFCPHGPDDGCECRKPKLGLLHRASAELGFDMSKSIVIGDKESDIEFGRRANAVTMLISKAGSSPAPAARPVHHIVNLDEAADIIQRRILPMPMG